AGEGDAGTGSVTGTDSDTGSGCAGGAQAGRRPADGPRPEPDLRTEGQRNHDALKEGLRRLLGSGALGQHRGMPTTVVMTMSLSDLEKRCGHALTGGGSLIPMRDAIRMASRANHYLAIFDD